MNNMKDNKIYHYMLKTQITFIYGSIILFFITRAMNTILFEEDYLEINFLYLKCWKSSQGLKLQRLKEKSLKKVFNAKENMKA